MLFDIFSSDELTSLRENIFPVSTKIVSKEELCQKGVLVFGAGAFGRSVVDLLARSGIIPAWIVDSKKQYWETTINNIPVFPPETLEKAKNMYVVLTSGWAREMYSMCMLHDAKNILLPMNLPVNVITNSAIGYKLEEIDSQEDIVRLYQILSDKLSRDTFKALIAYNVTLDNAYFSQCMKDNIYFPSDIDIDISNFVDAGAYTGDTFESWVQAIDPSVINSYYGFEPGPNYSFLEKKINLLQTVVAAKIYNIALGNSRTQIALRDELCQTLSLTSSDNTVLSSCSCTFDKLDSIMPGEKITYIKMDVEGWELQLMEGALSIITEQRPALAISVYHKRDDWWKLPLWLHDKKMDYTFYFRHYAPTWSDTVCYAIPRC